MKNSVSLRLFLGCFGLLVFTAGPVSAQEAVPLEEAQKIAHKLVAVAGGASELPFAIEADAEHPVALKGGDAGVLLMPDKHLTAEVLAGADKTFVPVGQLWAYKVTLVSGGNGFASDRLRVVTVGEGGQGRAVQLFSLGVTKNSEGGLELGVFGKGKEPLYRAPLQSAEAGKQAFPIEVTGQKTGEESARLTLNFAGRYTVNLEVIKGE